MTRTIDHPQLRKLPPDTRMMDAIVAVDPGPGTGIATYHPRPSIQGMNFDVETINLGHDGHLALRDRLRELGAFMAYGSVVTLPPEFVVLIVEPFEFRKDDSDERDKIDYMAAEYVGVAKTVGWETPPIDQTPGEAGYGYYDALVTQGASIGKGFWTNDKIAKLFGHLPGASRHDRDALRHLLHYMVFRRRQKWLLDALK